MEWQLIIGLALSALIGLSLGLIGGGGSIITVPVLVYVIGVEAHEAIGMSLAVVGATGLIGSILHYRQGTVQLKTALFFGFAGIFGAFAGSPVTHFFSPQALMLTFAVFMFIVAILMLRKKSDAANDKEIEKREPSLWKSLLAGFGVGVLTGFLGVGGGFLIVPALVMFAGLSMKDAIGTSLLVIFINCAAGLFSHASQGSFNWTITLLVTMLAAGGAILGTILSHRLSAHRLQKAFAVFVLLVAVFMVAKNYTVIF